jgi:hypothetical protein
MPTPLEIIAIQQRALLLAANGYNYPNNYNSTSSNALSDGDDKGKGELNGNIGTRTDINERNVLLSKNNYNSTNNYKCI